MPSRVSLKRQNKMRHACKQSEFKHALAPPIEGREELPPELAIYREYFGFVPKELLKELKLQRDYSQDPYAFQRIANRKSRSPTVKQLERRARRQARILERQRAADEKDAEDFRRWLDEHCES